MFDPRAVDPLGKRTASLLASTFVCIGGLVFGVFMICLTNDAPLEPLLAWCGLFAAVMALLWVFRDKPLNQKRQRNCFWLLAKKNRPQKTVYRLKRRRNVVCEPYGTNSPPTAETVRELSDGLHNWVPRRGKPGERGERGQE